MWTWAWSRGDVPALATDTVSAADTGAANCGGLAHEHPRAGVGGMAPRSQRPLRGSSSRPTSGARPRAVACEPGRTVPATPAKPAAAWRSDARDRRAVLAV